jgi:ferredoxin-like protein FixX
MLMAEQMVSVSLAKKGLNLQKLLLLSVLPDEVYHSIAATCTRLGLTIDNYDRVLLLGHGGTVFWQCLQQHLQTAPLSESYRDHPVDSYSYDLLSAYLNNVPEDGCGASTILFPHQPVAGEHLPLRLQALGQFAGWHHASPFMVGVNNDWGSWYAYRAVVLLGPELELDSKEGGEETKRGHQDAGESSPCDSCRPKPCISACPAGALVKGFDLKVCTGFRLSEGSVCAYQCLARLACPVGRQHQYTQQQMSYHYGQSLEMLKTYFD